MTKKIKKTFHRFFSDVFFDITIFLLVFTYAVLHSERSFHYMAGIVVALMGFVFRIISRIHLGDAFSVCPEARKLVKKGIYAKIRNPIYIFSLMAFSGTALAIGKPIYFLIIMLFFFMEIFRAKRERKVLYETFGEEYKEYRRKTRF